MPEVQSPKEFLNDFIAHAKHAKKSIYFQSMLFETGKALDALESILIQKAKEGVVVHITIDWLSQHAVHGDAVVFPQLNPKKQVYAKKLHQKTAKIIQRWQEAGIIFVVTNPPRIVAHVFSIVGRNHTKMYIVDDVCWIGGVNMFDLSFGWIDFMVKYTESSIVDAVYKHIKEVNEKRPVRDYSVKTNSTDTFLIDSGHIGKSLILTEAIKLIKKANKSLLFATQYAPNGQLLTELIKAAERGVQVSFITSPYRPYYSDFAYKLSYQWLLLLTKNKPNIKIYHQNRKVHAKLLVIDDNYALHGTHNMVPLGVYLGTEEVAVRTENKKLVRSLAEFITTHTKL